MGTPNKIQQIEAREGKPMREILMERFEKHGTLTGIADELGVSQGTVSLWLIRFNLKLETKAALVPMEGGEPS